MRLKKLPADAYVYRYNRDVHVVAGDDHSAFLEGSSLKGLTKQQKTNDILRNEHPLAEFIDNFMSESNKDVKVINLEAIPYYAYQSPDKLKKEILKQLDIKVTIGPDIEIT